MTRSALVLVGSPRGLERSASAELSRELLDAFDRATWTIDWIHLHNAVESDETAAELVSRVGGADLVLFAAPLYVDSLPAPAIDAFERIAAGRGGHSEQTGVPRFSVLLNCGFVEPRQNETAVEMCRVFADVAGFEWFGELTLGGAGRITGRIRKALKDAGESLAAGFPIPPEARRRARRPIMPKLLYVIGGNFMWRRVAKRFGVTKHDLLEQPYA